MRECGGEIIRRAAYNPIHLYDEVVIKIMGAFGDFADFGFEVFHRLIAHASRIGGYSEAEEFEALGEGGDMRFLRA